MTDTEKNKSEIFSVVQKFLRDPPVIIWGSGATIDYGLPSMESLKGILEEHFAEFAGNTANDNLEVLLGGIDDRDKIKKIKKVIRDEVLKKDVICFQKIIQSKTYFSSIAEMIRIFLNPHPRKLRIITTNYDRVLEYTLSNAGCGYTDGFTGQPLSKFDKHLFGKQQVDLVKVHGSLNWVTRNGKTFFMPCEFDIDDFEYTMVLPSQRKHFDTTQEPYRTLITKADEIIEEAKSFLIVGFGFNDEHLTPKIENKIGEGTPIVIITKTISQSCRGKLTNSSKYCLFEVDGTGTKVTLKKSARCTESILPVADEKFWKLNDFMRILT